MQVLHQRKDGVSITHMRTKAVSTHDCYVSGADVPNGASVHILFTDGHFTLARWNGYEGYIQNKHLRMEAKVKRADGGSQKTLLRSEKTTALTSFTGQGVANGTVVTLLEVDKKGFARVQDGSATGYIQTKHLISAVGAVVLPPSPPQPPVSPSPVAIGSGLDHNLLGIKNRAFWQSKGKKGLDASKLFEVVDKSGSEFLAVQAALTKTIPKAVVDKLERVENGFMHEAFHLQVYLPPFGLRRS